MMDYSDLWPEQKDAIAFMYERDHTLLFADVGMGKTVMVLTVLKEWFDTGVADRVLVVAPTRVCQAVWRQEIAVWRHLDGLEAVCLAGASETARRAAVASDAPILLLNYELLPWFMVTYPKAAGCNILVCDEIDKLKSPTSMRFRGGKSSKWKKRVPGMRQYRKLFETVIGMTGTPMPNHLLELWSQVYTVDGGERLGMNYYSDYRGKYFSATTTFGGFTKYHPLPGATFFVEEAIEDITFRIAATNGSGQRPEIRELPPRWLTLPSDLKKTYVSMERHFIAQVANEKLTAVSAGVQYGKLRQLAQGFAYTSDSDSRDNSLLRRDLSGYKLRELDSLISELQGAQLMIVYHYRAQAEVMHIRFTPDKFRYLGGGVPKNHATETIRQWNNGELPLLGIHPASAGHGLNLQKSSAHHIVFLTLPESAGAYDQVIGRIARTGNQAKNVFVHYILARNTVDEDRLSVVKDKIVSQDSMLKRMQERQHERTAA